MSKALKFFTPLLSAMVLSACSTEPEWVEVYEECKSTVHTEMDKIGATTAQGSEQSRAIQESMGNMAMQMALNACEMIRTACEQDEDGPTCRAYVERKRPQH